MPIDDDRVTAALTDALLRRQGDEVDLVFRYGSRLTGTAHRYSDVDISWVPAHEGTWDAITVLVDDILCDLYAMHWSTLEQMAVLENLSAAVLLEARVVYARTPSAAQRFAALGERLRHQAEPERLPDRMRRAGRRLRSAGWPRALLAETAAAGHVLGSLQQAAAIRTAVLHALVILNGVPADSRRRDAVLALERRPPGLAGLLDQLEHAVRPDELVAACDALLGATRALLVAEQRRTGRARTFPEVLDAGYPELRGDLQHIVLACERGLSPLALVSLHHELMAHVAMVVDGFEPDELNAIPDYEQDLAALGFPDLLGPALAGDAAEVAARCEGFDAHLREWLAERGVALNAFTGPADLEAWLAAR